MDDAALLEAEEQREQRDRLCGAVPIAAPAAPMTKFAARRLAAEAAKARGEVAAEAGEADTRFKGKARTLAAGDGEGEGEGEGDAAGAAAAAPKSALAKVIPTLTLTLKISP